MLDALCRYGSPSGAAGGNSTALDAEDEAVTTDVLTRPADLQDATRLKNCKPEGPRH